MRWVFTWYTSHANTGKTGPAARSVPASLVAWGWKVFSLDRRQRLASRAPELDRPARDEDEARARWWWRLR
jgi:hypothetical protein